MIASRPRPAHDAAGEEALLLQRTQALAPQIAAAGDEIERERRVPAPLLEAMIEAGLFRMLVPRSVGGAEVHPLTFMRVVETLAAQEASPAWNVCQNAVCGLAAAYLEPAVAREVFGDGRTILAWGPPQSGSRAVAGDGGYTVSGTWNFASGGRHANWLGAYAPIHEADGTPRPKAGGGTEARVLLFPAEKATWQDVWNVLGLQGTASDAFSVEDLYVPHAYTLVRDTTEGVREPGWLYAFKTTNLFACGFASIALGVARAMLDAFMALAQEKTPRGFSNPLRENAATQSELAQAEAQHGAARALLKATVREICAEVEETRALRMEHRMRIRLAATHAIQQAMQVGDFAYGAAGSSAIFAGGPFERRFRDLHTIGQQVQGRRSHFQTVGKFLLGLEAETTFL